MALVFDIETVGERWDELDDTTQHNLSWYLRESTRTDEEFEYEMKELKDGLGLSPLTGFIVAIGVYDTEKERGAVYYEDRGERSSPREEGGIKYKRRFYDQKYAQGTLVPYRSVLTANDKIIEEQEISSITFGQKVDEDLFKAN